MKTLKFIIFVVFMISLASCYNDSPYDTVKDSEKETTLYLLNLPADTVTMAVDGNTMYIFTLGDDRVIVKTKTIDSDGMVPIPLFMVVFMIVLSFIGIINLLEKIFK
jgi:hypothetical protein